MPARPLGVEELNRLQREGYARADELEPRFVRVLEPILNRAADEAASRFALHATDYLTAAAVHTARAADQEALAGMSRPEARSLVSSLALTAAAPEPSSCMVCVYPRPDEQAALAEPGGEPAEIIHTTLCYIGEVDREVAERVAEALGVVAGTHPPLGGTVGGIGSFDDNGSGYPSVLFPDVPGLVELRMAVCEAIIGAGVDYARNHGYTAHATIAYREGEPSPPEATSLGAPLHFDAIHVVQGDVILATLPLTGVPALTAAANWGAPAPNEVVDVDALVAQLRGKTDPVRLAVIKDSMTPILEGAGIDFDITNPLAANVLAQSGSQIVNIAETTQLNAMRIIRRSYEEGLSIPDTAKAIRGGMKEATRARATLIARTELVGATNGGSLAAVQIVENVTGKTYWKEWLTSPGAPHPRHDHYPGLDHQTRKLTEAFDVGGHPLDHPGDPMGPPEDVCNCRCTLAYVDKPPAGQEPPLEGASEAVAYEGDWTPNEPRLTAVRDVVRDLTSRYDVPLKRVVVREAEEFNQLAGKSNDTIYVSPRFLDDEFMDEHLQDWSRVSVQTEPADIITHEFGHIVDGYLLRHHRAEYDVLDAWLNEEVSAGGLTTTRVRHSFEAPSAYGNENRYEFFAEAFADWVKNGEAAHPSSQYIGRMVDRVVGRPTVLLTPRLAPTGLRPSTSARTR